MWSRRSGVRVPSLTPLEPRISTGVLAFVTAAHKARRAPTGHQLTVFFFCQSRMEPASEGMTHRFLGTPIAGSHRDSWRFSDVGVRNRRSQVRILSGAFPFRPQSRLEWRSSGGRLERMELGRFQPLRLSRLGKPSRKPSRAQSPAMSPIPALSPCGSSRSLQAAPFWSFSSLRATTDARAPASP